MLATVAIGSSSRDWLQCAEVGFHAGVSDEGPEAAADPVVEPDPEQARADGAAAALARARRVARDRGLRPGAPVRRARTAGDFQRFAARSDDYRDPAMLGDQLDRLLRERDWRVDVAAGSVMGRWAEIVGPDVATHAAPVSFEAGVLVVRAESTAWATQLRWLTSSLLARLAAAVGEGVVQELKIVGPSAPSWKKGPRSVSDGRGPRDTYG